MGVGRRGAGCGGRGCGPKGGCGGCSGGAYKLPLSRRYEWPARQQRSHRPSAATPHCHTAGLTATDPHAAVTAPRRRLLAAN